MKELINKKNNVIFFILLLFSISFMNLAGYILLPLVIWVFFNIVKRKEILVNKSIISLIIFSSLYFIVYSFYFSITLKNIIYFFIGPIGCFLLGSELINSNNININEKKLYKLILITSYGMFLHGFLNMIVTLNRYGINNKSRTVIDFWRGNEIAATGQGIFFTMICSLFFTVLFYKSNNKLEKVGITFATAFSLFSTLVLANRTLIVIIAIVGIVAIILYI
ncbi:MAG: hypothetical protein ACRC7N_21770, partial [Clostridium sp.]